MIKTMAHDAVLSLLLLITSMNTDTRVSGNQSKVQISIGVKVITALLQSHESNSLI